ncbi:hypothetical protein SeMB42_g06533 [Synchytrium endobioticum]|uniref:Cytochrome c oxidase subunit 5b n=1 Tax=Synchytrium endobioticum TaxID=286115 RepID=A0A507CI06_9FUNG|nr:hypothetical protein SeMB42_g06533 [Synchytrium endobioticum]TPX39220.1 hypothetical protein SeLEV6574_g07372 [Synchytrium endobioticum]
MGSCRQLTSSPSIRAARVFKTTTNARVLAISKAYDHHATNHAKDQHAVQGTTVPPQIPGYRAPGEVATNWELATGNERYEYLAKLAGQDPWEDLHPIVQTQMGTKSNPVVVKGVDPERYIGCTGFPADSHEVVWLTVRPGKHFDRCPHCGNVFKYIQEHAHH